MNDGMADLSGTVTANLIVFMVRKMTSFVRIRCEATVQLYIDCILFCPHTVTIKFLILPFFHATSKVFFLPGERADVVDTQKKKKDFPILPSELCQKRLFLTHCETVLLYV